MDQLYSGEYGEAHRYLGPQIETLNKFLSYVPRLEVDIQIMPITRAILKVQLTITPAF